MATITTEKYGHQFECPDLPPPIRPGLALDDPFRAKLIRQAEKAARQVKKRTERFKRKRQNRIERDQQQREGQQ